VPRRDGRTRAELRDGVKEGVLASIRHDVERRGGRTGRLLLASGAIGIAGATGAILLISGHPFEHHPPWHVAVFSTVWTGLLVVFAALVLLRVRTPALPLWRAAAIAIVGLGIAGACSALCPDPHFLTWWLATPAGASLAGAAGTELSALCFGLSSSVFFGGASALLLLSKSGDSALESLLHAAFLFVLLAPGVVLQSVGTSFGIAVGWLAGTAAGAYLGVLAASRVRARLARS